MESDNSLKTVFGIFQDFRPGLFFFFDLEIGMRKTKRNLKFDII